MRIILDTHIFLWTLAEPERLSDRSRQLVESVANIVYVSAVSIAEIAIKSSLGKLDIDFDPTTAAAESGFELLDFNAEAAWKLKELPLHHRDPFDRMLVAQSLVTRYHLMSDDAQLVHYGCRLVGR